MDEATDAPPRRPDPAAADGDGGLTPEEAAARLARDGPNAVPVAPPPPWWRPLIGQIVHPFALMLWTAAVLAAVVGLPQLGIAIVLVIVANGAFSFLQEHRAERAAERLRDLLPRRVLVVRGGRLDEVDASSLVRGDRVRLTTGDRIPADLRLVGAHAALVDVSTLTGESVPVGIDSGEHAYAGTFLVGGEADGVVEATGAGTRLGAIATLTRATTRPETPFSIELRRLVRTLAWIALGVGAGFFALALALGTPATDGLTFAIGVAVALVPEALMPTVTLSLAIAAQRMAARHALVRRLDAVQTLGSTTFVCTDKTGTLTRNEMTVVDVWTPEGAASIRGAGYGPVADVRVDDLALPSVRRAAVTAARCTTGRAVETDGGWAARGDPMDAACWAFARRVGADPDGDVGRERRRFPFDTRRRRISIVAGDRLLTKGAPDQVLARSTGADGAAEALEAMTSRGLRVLAVAERELDGADPTDPDAAERDLRLLGLLGFLDPPRAEVADAIAACRRAGIRIAMVTGDHPATALAIAREVGLVVDGEATVLLGDELPTDEQVLGAILDRDGVVVARVDPTHKLAIARALRARGHVVAMTGDGVNDGPALQEADIGVAMGRTGTDVAREAADLVLLDDDFATIVAAIEKGRASFSNARRFLTYHLTDNVAELTPFVVWALSGGRIPLALTVLQIIALDLGTDTLSAIALGAEPPGRRALAGPPLRGRLLDRTVAERAFGVLGPLEALFEMGAFFATFLAAGWRPGD
ncbi:MAG TPA: cation-transporting P-type ATPase, partial [Actinomycetota bacterium]